jgi:hypothetical protein
MLYCALDPELDDVTGKYYRYTLLLIVGLLCKVIFFPAKIQKKHLAGKKIYFANERGLTFDISWAFQLILILKFSVNVGKKSQPKLPMMSN